MRIVVLGAGAFGSALAITLARAGRDVTLWGRDGKALTEMALTRQNPRFLPGVTFPDALKISADTPPADLRLLAVPTRSLAELAGELTGDAPLVACCKGIDKASGLGPTDLLARSHPNAIRMVLSGPGFAEDLARGLPTAMTLACKDEAALAQMQEVLSTGELRLYRSHDVSGVELGGAIKNVIALAAGIVTGLGLGESARAALITRGYAEMLRYALAQGAEAATLAGLSGLGDLVLTATSAKSRNTSHGILLAQGKPQAQGVTVEALGTTFALAEHARAQGIDMPITLTLEQVLRGQIGVRDAVAALMGRPLKAEGE